VLGAEMFEWTIDGRDPTRGNARIACRRLRLGMSEKGLDITKVGPLLEQFCREGMSQGMEASLMGPVMSSRPVRQILVSASVDGHSSFACKERSSIGPPIANCLPISRQPVTCFSPWSAQRLPA